MGYIAEIVCGCDDVSVVKSGVVNGLDSTRWERQLRFASCQGDSQSRGGAVKVWRAVIVVAGLY
jgi:hypothetical protein